MSKTNFTKVEGSLDKGLEKLKIEKIVSETRTQEGEKSSNPKLYLIQSIKYDIETLLPIEPKLFEKIGIKKKELKAFLKQPEKLTDKDWKILQEIRLKFDEIKKELQKKIKAPTNEELIEAQREKHINKRFNTNDKWLPLH